MRQSPVFSPRLLHATALACAMLAGSAPALCAEHLQGTQRQQQRGYSPGVVTEGGRTVWLAGHSATEDAQGKSIAYDFEAQVQTVFDLMEQTLKRAGGSLADVVTMTVFINDPRLGDKFVELRKQRFQPGKFPASALITVSNFARPGIVVEIQGVAVVGERETAAKQ